MNLLRSLGKLLAFDLTGKTWTEGHSHPYFQNLIYFGSKKSGQSYWEADISVPEGKEGRVGVTMTGNRSGPTEEEENFCRAVTGDLDALFVRCREAFTPEFEKWAKCSMPSEWRDAFQLDGFEVPVAGDPINDWEVCYFVKAVDHNFVAAFKNGKVAHVAVDG